MIKLIYFKDGIQYFLEDAVESVKWSGDIKQASRKLDVSLMNLGDVSIENGKEIRFYYNDVELFRGIIFETSINQIGEMSITVYDELKYLTTNNENRLFKSTKASSIVSTLCGDFGIPVGTVTDTGYAIKKMITNGTLWDTFQRALSYTKEKTGRNYYIYSSEGKLNLVERKSEVVRWVIESGSNLETASRRISIENLRNSIKLISGDIEKSPKINVYKDDTSIAKYGKMQEVENVDEKETRLKEIADRKLKELNKPEDEITVTAAGITGIISGRGVYAYDTLTNLSGGYYVTQDSHSFDSDGTYSMDLTLSATDDLQFDTLDLNAIDELDGKEN